MGIFKKRVKQEQDTTFTNEPPLSGGDAFIVKKTLEVQDTINKNTIPYFSSEIKKLFNTSSKDKTYELWWILNFHADYFVSIYPIKCEEAYLTRMINALFRIHFLYGNCGIYRNPNGEFIPIYETRVDCDKSGRPKKILGNLIWDILAGQDLDAKNFKPNIVISKDEIENNYVRLCTKSSGFGAIITWLPFVKQQVSLLKKIYAYSYMFFRKTLYNVGDNSTSLKEIELFFNDDIPFFINLDAFDGVSKRFTSEGIDSGSGSGVDELINYYNFVIDVYYSLLGRRSNVDTKVERNVVSEVEASQDNFDILQMEDRVLKEAFMDELKSKFGIKWEKVENSAIIEGGKEVDNPNKEGESNDIQRVSKNGA